MHNPVSRRRKNYEKICQEYGSYGGTGNGTAMLRGRKSRYEKDGKVTVMLDKLDEIIAEISGNTLVCDDGRSKTVFTKVIN